MHKNATKCNETLNKWCKNKHGASKIMDTLETYHFVAFLILYVNDILLIGNDMELLKSVKDYLNSKFSMKDLGDAAYILGIKIYRDRSRCLIGLSQSTYLDKILKKFRMDESKKEFLPMLQGKTLSKTRSPATAEDREEINNIPYASAIGSIMYGDVYARVYSCRQC
jgi:hypothetical protein